MLRELLILGICAGTAASIPILYESNPEAAQRILKSVFSDDPGVAVPETRLEVPPAKVSPVEALPNRKVSIEVGPQGHFNAEFKLNGRAIPAMVDTGATLVAINLTTARRIGIPVAQHDFKYSVTTANGRARAASAVIDRLQIGRITVENVEAMVLDDKALAGTLIGASFLNRLAKYQVEGGKLLLMQ